VKVFLYGTLKRGHRLHYAMEAQRFVSEAHTEPRYRLISLGTYPGMVESVDGFSIEGEIWEVDEACLHELDMIEAVAEGEYARAQVLLVPPHNDEPVEGYLYLGDITGLGDCGSRW
jgi:gamma-glutamylaminecyclotransferase